MAWGRSGVRYKRSFSPYQNGLYIALISELFAEFQVGFAALRVKKAGENVYYTGEEHFTVFFLVSFQVLLNLIKAEFESRLEAI